MHVPHRSISDLKHPNHENVPTDLQWYAAVTHRLPEFWQNTENINLYLPSQEEYITTALSYINTLSDAFYMWQTRIIPLTWLNFDFQNETTTILLDTNQLSVQNHVLRLGREHKEHFSSFAPSEYLDNDAEFVSGSDADDKFSPMDASHPSPVFCHGSPPNTWGKPILVTGSGGCGKSYTNRSIVNEYLTRLCQSLSLARLCLSLVHAAFFYPVESDILPKINLNILKYDLIIIDKLSMIPETIFQHILKTLNLLLFRPVLVLCRDCAQQQTFSKHNVRIMQLPSPFTNKHFISTTY
jgi:hypothetical protein